MFVGCPYSHRRMVRKDPESQIHFHLIEVHIHDKVPTCSLVELPVLSVKIYNSLCGWPVSIYIWYIDTLSNDALQGKSHTSDLKHWGNVLFLLWNAESSLLFQFSSGTYPGQYHRPQWETNCCAFVNRRQPFCLAVIRGKLRGSHQTVMGMARAGC